MAKKKNKAGYILRHSKGFFITSLSLITLFTAVDVVALGIPFIENTLNTVLGDTRRVVVSGDPDKAKKYFKTDDGITDKKSALSYANSVNEKIGEEGRVLLKNDSSLPLKKEAKVSVYGRNQNNLVYSGSGSSSKSNDDTIGLFEAFDKANLSYNPDLKKFYDDKKKAGKGHGASPTFGDIIDGFSTGELALNEYSSTPSSRAGEYKDAAIVVFSRIGGEGYDLPRERKNIKGANEEDHYLRLDNNEKALLDDLCSDSSPFENVIVLINSGTSMELGFLNDTAYSKKLKGALWIGDPGGKGLSSLGKLLTGEVSPSGHLTDTYVKDFFTIPSVKNFGTNNKTDGDRYTIDGVNTDYYFVDYEEGIYIGYKYYETRGYTDGESWYKDNVVFPFGYGLSYADFKWNLASVTLEGKARPESLTEEDLDKTIERTIEVENTSDTYSGKDVVQLYGKAPYYEGGIEKSQVVLLDFAKTKTLAPKEKEEVKVQSTLRGLSSYDYNDANKNGHQGYELDLGNYELLIGKNAHQAWKDSSLKTSFVLNDTINIDKDERTGTETKNRFDDVSSHIKSYLSRNNWSETFPTTPTDEDRNVTQEFIDSFSVESYIGKGPTLDQDKPWYSKKAPRQQIVPRKEEEATVKLYDLIGKDYDDPLWSSLLNQLTVKQLCYLIGTGNFNTADISVIGKPKTIDPDGPSGFANFRSAVDSTALVYDTAFYACESLIGATYSKELAKAVGNAIGNEGLIGNERGDKRPYSGWYAPAVNIHRTPFSGRNWEYYSEDGTFNGLMAAETVKGAMEKGVYTYIKHFALNDQETHRDSMGLATWCNEQARREIYFKPFEYTVKKGKTTARMSSFNRIGNVWAGGNYSLLTEILRNEWGFKGTVITDYNTHGEYRNPDQRIRAGGSLNLIQDRQPSSSGANYNATHRLALRKAGHDILYTVANSCARNGYDPSVKYGYAPAYWKIVLYAVNGAVFAGLAVFGFFSIRKSLKKLKAESEE